MYHAEDPSYKPITNITAINFVNGMLVANTNFTYANATDLWLVYKQEDVPVAGQNVSFYAINLDTNETIYLGTVETGSGGEAYLTDYSILNTLDVAHNNYTIFANTTHSNLNGTGYMRLFPRNSSIDNASKTINHGEDTNLTIRLNDLYDGSPIVNRTVHVTIKDKDGKIIKDYDIVSDENSNIFINVPNLDTGNYTVLTVFNSALSYTNCSNVSSIEVIPSAKLNISKVLDTIQDYYIKGEELNWTITVTNIGEVTAHDVNVTDIPTYLVITSHKTDNGTFSDGVWHIGDLAVVDVVVLHVTTIVTGSKIVASNL